MKVLVLGGNGYIGSELVSYFSRPDSEIEVVGFGSRQNDYNKLSSEYLQSFSHIVLLAGHSSVQMCAGPLDYPWKNNVRNFVNLLNKTSTSQTIIYASSASVYGQSNTKIFTEEDSKYDYVNNYDLTKTTIDLIAEKHIRKCRRIFGLRFGTVNGASRVIRRDLMINSMVYSAINTGKIFITNKTINRPILFMDDLVRAVEAVVKSKDIFNGIYNLASFNSNVEEISNYVSKATGAEIIDNGDVEGVYNFRLDTTKFTNAFSFNFNGTVELTTDSVVSCYKTQQPKVVIRNQIFEYD